MDTTRTRLRPDDDGAEPAGAEASVMAASPVRCGFCLSERGKKDKYRSLHPSVPQSLLEEDTPPLVCTPCYNFLYSEFARKCGDDRAASDSESDDEETGQKALKRRYPNALSANNGLPPAKRLYMLLMAKLFTKSAKLPSLSVDRFSLKGIPFTSDRSFAFDPRKVHFGVRHGAMGENGQSPVASMEGRLPWLTSLLTKNGGQPDTADVAVRKRSRLSWCNPKKPCIYCLNHIDAVASGLSRGTRRKSCLCMPASWKSIDEKTRSEARDAAFSALDCNAVSPLVPAPGLDSEEGASTPPPRSPTQESSGKTWQENRGDSDRESEMALEAVKKVRIKNEADDSDMGHQAGEKEQPDSSSGSKNVVGVSRPAKRLRSLLRGDQKPRAVEESAAAIGERSDAAEPDEGDGDEAGEKATADGGNAAERNDTEAPHRKPAKMVRKRRRGLSAELRSLQLWSHWEEEEEDSTNDNENEESDNKKEERKRKKHKENEKWDEDEEEEEEQYRRGKLRRSAKSSDTEAKKDEQPRRTRWAKRDSESEEEEQNRTTKRKVDEKLEKKEREKEEEARKERRESELRRSLRSREEREKARLEREAKLRAEEAKRKLEQERREQEKKKRDQKKKDKAKIEQEKEEEEEMRRERKEEEKRRDKRKKSTSQLKTATSTNSTPTSNGPPKEEDTAVAALLSLISENAAPQTPAALPALDEATVQKLSASMSSRPSLATSVQFEEIVLDDDEDNDNADSDRHRLRKAAKPGNVAAGADPRQTHLPSLATLFLGSSLPQSSSSIAGVPALPPSLPHVPLPPSPSGLRASSTVAAKPPSQAPHRASPRPSTPPSPSPTSAPATQSTAHYAGVGQALPPAPPGYPYATAVANAARAMTPQHAYAAQLTAAQMAHINPQMLLQLLQSLHFPPGSQAAAAHAAQALMYAPLLNLPPGAAQFRPPTSSYPSAPPAPPAATTRTHQAAPPRTWPPPNHHK